MENERILHAARDFRIASEILKGRFGQPVFPLRSTIVTMAFSIELYLKYLTSCANIKIEREHDLLKIYNKLPASIKDDITATFKGPRPIPDILEDFKMLFVDWRYIYDKQDRAISINDIPSLVSLQDALEIVAVKYT